MDQEDASPSISTGTCICNGAERFAFSVPASPAGTYVHLDHGLWSHDASIHHLDRSERERTEWRDLQLQI